MDGNCHIAAKATIDADALIGGKSFLGHKHLGNLGAPTSTPL
jgi:UDP-3-O-[3-hydroxymyristoyl] glucosamine N-acyltransferase